MADSPPNVQHLTQTSPARTSPCSEHGPRASQRLCETERVPPLGPQAAWAQYAQLKQDWIARHPDASPAEFDAAMQEIAERCGV